MMITPEMFAEVLCDDLDLNPVNFVPAIAQVIRSQLEQYSADQAEQVENPTNDQRVTLKVCFYQYYNYGSKYFKRLAIHYT